MLVLRSPVELPRASRGCCLAWGMFDGVHLGHQHVIRAALTEARTHGAPAVALTFDPHPLRVVAPERAPRLLQPLSQRLRNFSELGLHAALVFPFTAEVAAWSGERFIRQLVQEAGGLRSLSVGEGFQFGNSRSGDIPLLERLGRELGFGLHVASPVSLGGNVVSSSRIRQCLRAGQLDQVNELLGRAYAISGVVQPGDRLGRQWGVPTANLNVLGLELPPFGVYAARVRRLARSEDFPGVLNVGVRPTLGQPQGELRFEVHLLDFDGDLYGEELEVTFVEFLRAEQRFGSLDLLREQIGRDLLAARHALG
ncbi:MAG: bifunctional riboflavin kinase/FAD synthetase [Verrucomicrobia bacterium]|nr:bifunctional riboflavin kinase/FAD synthetase [Verrucomicrobiota bacterium]